MEQGRIDFAALDWDESVAGVRSKAIVRDGKRLRLVEFTDEFVEQEWCMKRHAGYVLDGEIEIAFPGRTDRFAAGDGILIGGGESERHKTKVVGSAAKLILAEDV